jgi:hypothetical protein
LGQAVGPETIGELHDQLVTISQARNAIHGNKMRVDTTVVESNIHYPFGQDIHAARLVSFLVIMINESGANRRFFACRRLTLGNVEPAALAKGKPILPRG